MTKYTDYDANHEAGISAAKFRAAEYALPFNCFPLME